MLSKFVMQSDSSGFVLGGVNSQVHADLDAFPRGHYELEMNQKGPVR